MTDRLREFAGENGQTASCNEWVVDSFFYLLKTNRLMEQHVKDEPNAASPVFIFGVSGHRDVPPENIPELREQIRAVFDRFRSAYPDASYELLSPLAEGADRAAAEEALTRGIRLIVPLPMAQSDYEKDFTTPESLGEFRRLLAASDSHFEVRSSEVKRDRRSEKYAAVGDYIARRSHVLILLWDGRDNEKIGGTAWVKKRREYWVERSKAEGNTPPLFGYAGTIHILSPRIATAGQRPTSG